MSKPQPKERRHAADELLDPNVVVQFGRPPNRIDLIASLRTVPFDQAWQTRIVANLDLGGSKVPIFVLGLQELRRAKLEAGRPKDFDDLQHLPKA